MKEERSWLLQVTRNHCYNRLRSSARGPTVPVDAEEVVSRSADDPEQCSLLRAQIRWLLSLLPDRQREVMIRRAVLDQDLVTVAARLGLSYGAAAQLVYRARRMLVHAGDSAWAGVLVVGTRLAGLRARLRELGLRAMSAGRELVLRSPLLNAAVALPLSVIAAVVGAAPVPSEPAVGPPSSGATLAAEAMVRHSRPAGVQAETAASAATDLQGGAASTPSPSPMPSNAKAVLRGEVHLPPPPPQAGPVVHCQQIGGWRTSPDPSSVPLVPTIVVQTSVPILVR